MTGTPSSLSPRRARPFLRRSLAVVVATLVAAAWAPPADARPPPRGTPDGWALTWQAEWNEPAGTQPPRGTWNYELGNRSTNGWGNHELQYYTDNPANVATDGRGHLAITARRADPGADLPCWDGGNCAFTSSRLTTAGNFTVTYGRIEARMRVPAGTGLWPAFWMMGATGSWPTGGEIDVMEWVGKEPRTVYGALHGPNATGGVYSMGGSTRPGPPLSAGWHDFAVEKRPGDVRWFVDGRQYFRVTRADIPAGARWPFDQPFYLLLNLAVGGSWPGPPNASTPFPAQLLVDWVRVWS